MPLWIVCKDDLMELFAPQQVTLVDSIPNIFYWISLESLLVESKKLHML